MKSGSHDLGQISSMSCDANRSHNRTKHRLCVDLVKSRQEDECFFYVLLPCLGIYNACINIIHWQSSRRVRLGSLLHKLLSRCFMMCCALREMGLAKFSGRNCTRLSAMLSTTCLLLITQWITLIAAFNKPKLFWKFLFFETIRLVHRMNEICTSSVYGICKIFNIRNSCPWRLLVLF